MQATIDRQTELIAMLETAEIGTRIYFQEEARPYRVRARSNRYLVCTKPFNARKTVIYTVIDLEDMVRGTENLVFCAGAETDEDCQEMIQRLEGMDIDLGFQTEVSHRNRIQLNVTRLERAAIAPPAGEDDEPSILKGTDRSTSGAIGQP